jgi:hypothetical protein
MQPDLYNVKQKIKSYIGISTSLLILKMRIFRFKTNIFKSDLEKIGKILSRYKGIRWKIDNDSKNNVLQVNGYGVTPGEIITSIKAAGYECRELE